jgi:hypothetical protein
VVPRPDRNGPALSTTHDCAAFSSTFGSAGDRGDAAGAENFGPRLGNFLRSGRTEMAVIIAIKLAKQGVRIYTLYDSLLCIRKRQLDPHYRVIRRVKRKSSITCSYAF